VFIQGEKEGRTEAGRRSSIRLGFLRMMCCRPEKVVVEIEPATGRWEAAEIRAGPVEVEAVGC
jgi:hypothetical protein